MEISRVPDSILITYPNEIPVVVVFVYETPLPVLRNYAIAEAERQKERVKE